MINQIRTFSKSWAAKILLGLVALSFVFVGSQTDFFGLSLSRDVVQAGDRSINPVQFKAEFDRWKEGVEAQNGPLTVEEIDARGGIQGFLDMQVSRAGFSHWAWNAGVRPGAELITKAVRDIPAFFNSITGKFDEDAYKSALAQQNLDPKTFEADVRDQYAQRHIGTALGSGVYVPRVYGALAAVSAAQTRDASWFTVTQAMAGTAPAPTDAQLTELLNENRAALQRPEFRRLTVVLFGPSSVNPPEPTAEQIQERFDFRKDTLSRPETRSYVAFSTDDQAAAQRVSAALRAGQTPEQAGQAANLEPQAFENRPRSAIQDEAVAGAVFGTGSGQASAPVRGSLGWTVVAVTAVTPGQAATLDSARAEIVNELKTEAAKRLAYEKTEQYQAAREGGADIEAAARQAGVEVVKIDPLSKEGVTPDGAQVRAPAQVLTTAFALTRGETSELVDVGDVQYFALRVDEIIPAAMPSLDSLRDQLTRAWTQRANAQLLTSKAEEFAQRIRDGETVAAVAASAGATVTTRPGMRADEETVAAVGQGVLRGVFSQQKAGTVFTGAGADGSTQVVGQLTRINAPAPALASRAAAGLRPRLSPQIGQELLSGIEGGAIAVSGANGNIANARAAVGLQPATAPAAPAKK